MFSFFYLVLKNLMDSVEYEGFYENCEFFEIDYKYECIFISLILCKFDEED